jgi:predicted DNA binding CopG/RHH family protein
MKKHLIPSFTSEEQERQFWDKTDSTRHVDWEAGRRVILPNLKPTQRTISLRLPAMTLAELKRLANRRDVPYQSLMKVFIAERLAEELHGPRSKRKRSPTTRSTRRASASRRLQNRGKRRAARPAG